MKYKFSHADVFHLAQDFVDSGGTYRRAAEWYHISKGTIRRALNNRLYELDKNWYNL